MSHSHRPLALIAAVLSLLVYPLALADEPAESPLKSVKNFMVQLDDLDDAGAVDRLAKSGYDMLVVEPTFNIKGNGKFDAAAMVKSLHDGKPGRIVLAYLNIGEAESNRTYWREDWHVASAGESAHPNFLLGADPDDAASFQVLYWRSGWRKLLTNDKGVVGKIMDAGFDGVYLDGIDAYDDEKVDDAAAHEKSKVNPDKAMLDLISAVRKRVREDKPDAVVVAQDAPFFIDDAPRFPAVVDGVAFEDTWFSGKDDADWDSPDAGDIPNKDSEDDSTAGLIREYQKYRHAGLPVFTIDFCVNPENAAKVYRDSAAAGFIPLVTRASEDDITPTPPPNLPIAVQPPR
ncbi:MAG TPA: endo alpha-1,4 polygalactosaminidase [Tepidisphaeraceae bacterium]|nr:endo alpha-1,4 polygalactosaminidase [Tepidisphaeraceae bacterium]